MAKAKKDIKVQEKPQEVLEEKPVFKLLVKPSWPEFWKKWKGEHLALAPNGKLPKNGLELALAEWELL